MKEKIDLTNKNKEEWKQVKSLTERPSIRAKLKKYEQEIKEEEKAKEDMMKAIADAVRNQKGRD